MPRFSEAALSGWTKPPSDTEEDKLSNSERMVRQAIDDDPKLSKRSMEVFGQGSYANDTNVRLDSDIDINVRLTDLFWFDLPPNTVRSDFQLNDPISYTFAEYKADVQKALENKFGSEQVVRKNKCLTVLGNTFRVETDVVPTWNHRRYKKDGTFDLGAYLVADDFSTVVNYPRHHIENGRAKNAATFRRFKRLTRIHKKLRYKMVEDGEYVNDAITSFLLECLVWNVPDFIFINYDTWQERLRQSIIYLHERTSEEGNVEDWTEVSRLLLLFYWQRKWTRMDANQYLYKLWHYLGYDK